MLKKRNRLRLKRNTLFFSQAKRIHGSGYTVFIRAHRHREAQIACIAPKKHAPLAVQRQLARRRARAYCAELLQQQLLEPLEYVVVLQKNFITQDKQRVLRELQEAGNKVYSSTGK